MKVTQRDIVEVNFLFPEKIEINGRTKQNSTISEV